MTTDVLKVEKKGIPLLLKVVLGLCVLAAGIGIGIGIGAGIWEGSSASNRGSIVSPASEANSSDIDWLVVAPAERLLITLDSNDTDAFMSNSTMLTITLFGIADTVLAFTNRPVRTAQALPTSTAMDIFNSDKSDTFNAVVTFKLMGSAMQVPIDILSVVPVGNNGYALNATILQAPGPLTNKAFVNLEVTEFNSSNVQMVYDAIRTGYEATDDVFLFVDDIECFPPFKCNPTEGRDYGASCDSNQQCWSNSCGRKTADDDAPKVCCYGEVRPYGGFDYCNGMVKGASCWSDWMCGGIGPSWASQMICQGNAGGTRRGVCGPPGEEVKKMEGEQCENNNQCANDNCGRATAADDAKKVCCRAGSIAATYDGFDYCTNMPDGSTCWSDAQCGSGRCEGNGGGTKKGTCNALLSPGAGCDSNGQCRNGQCGRATAAEGAAKVCCPDGSTAATYDGFDYCTNMPDGSTCWSDAQCGSGRCEGNGGGVQRGTCVRLRSAREGCDSNGQCQNGACGRASADDDAPKVCCPYGGGVDTFGGFDYCTNMPPGTRCWSDAMCQNGNCKGNGYGVQRGNCN